MTMKQLFLATLFGGLVGAALALTGVYALGWPERVVVHEQVLARPSRAEGAHEQLVLRGAGAARVVLGFRDWQGTVPGLWMYDTAGNLRAELVIESQRSREDASGHFALLPDGEHRELELSVAENGPRGSASSLQVGGGSVSLHSSVQGSGLYVSPEMAAKCLWAPSPGVLAEARR